MVSPEGFVARAKQMQEDLERQRQRFVRHLGR
jgi:hypothetical protein